MNVRKASGALLLTLFAGCATGDGWVCEKSGATEAQIKRDRDECFAQSVDTENRFGVGLGISREAYKACMEARGYRVRTATTG
jgi:hypothetical protein